MLLERSPAADGPSRAPAAAVLAAAAAAPSMRPADALADEVALLVLADIVPAARLWGWSRFVLGGWALRRVPGLAFARQLGSGHDGGFGLRPSGSRQGLFLLFDDEAAADAFVDASPEMAGYRRRASELCTVKLRAFSSRGRWGGVAAAVAAAPPVAGPIAALTRASIRPRKALAFWRMAPAAQAALGSAPGCRLAVGLGEAPLLRQATFSLWDSVEAMNAYARGGAHLAAIRAAQRDGHFSESMFVRFVPLAVRGQWKGRTLG